MQNDLTRQILKLIRDYIDAQKISMSEFGRQTGVSKAWLSKLKNTDANLSLDTAGSLLRYLGYRLKLTKDACRIELSRMRKYAERREPGYMRKMAEDNANTTTVTVPAPPPTPATPGQTIKVNPGDTISITAMKRLPRRIA